MPFKSDKQRRAAFANMNKGRLPKPGRSRPNIKGAKKARVKIQRHYYWEGESERHSDVQPNKGKKKITMTEEMAGMGKGKWREEHHSGGMSHIPYTEYLRLNKDTNKIERISIYNKKDGTCDVDYNQNVDSSDSHTTALASGVPWKEAKRLAEQKIRTSNMISGTGL